MGMRRKSIFFRILSSSRSRSSCDIFRIDNGIPSLDVKSSTAWLESCELPWSTEILSLRSGGVDVIVHGTFGGAQFPTR